jgi:sucrose-6-phosphatase
MQAAQRLGLLLMPFLLVTDLDHTLVGDRAALTALNQQVTASRQAGMKLVYATGRSLTLYRQLQTEVDLLDPDVLITAVGTEIYHHGQASPDATWTAKLAIGWHRATILAITQTITDLIPQPTSEQNPFKVSFFLTPTAAPTVLTELTRRLHQPGLATQLIYSSGKDLDILPKVANKGTAMTFVRQQLGFSADRTVACGDSGNDIALFANGDARGIIVGNAQPELLAWHEANPRDDRYLAQAAYAAGILEGLQYFGLISVES